jgi:hypothetical protein
VSDDRDSAKPQADTQLDKDLHQVARDPVEVRTRRVVEDPGLEPASIQALDQELEVSGRAAKVCAGSSSMRK